MINDVNASLMLKVGGVTASSSLMANMVIFNDPAYMWLSIIGALLSLVGIIHEMYHTKENRTLGGILTELFKAFMLGGILTPMYFMGYLHMGAKIVGIDGLDGIFNSFWFLLSMLTAWYSPLIWGFIVKSAFKRFGRIEK